MRPSNTENKRTPNIVVRFLYAFGNFFLDFAPIVNGILDYIKRALLNLTNFLIIIGTIVFSVTHSIRLLKDGGATGGLEYVGILMWEMTFLATTISMTQSFKKGKRPHWIVYVGFAFGFAFVEWSNITGMAQNWTGLILGSATPFLLIITEGIIAVGDSGKDLSHVRKLKKKIEELELELIEARKLALPAVNGTSQRVVNEEKKVSRVEVNMISQTGVTEELVDHLAEGIIKPPTGEQIDQQQSPLVPPVDANAGVTEVVAMEKNESNNDPESLLISQGIDFENPEKETVLINLEEASSVKKEESVTPFVESYEEKKVVEEQVENVAQEIPSQELNDTQDEDVQEIIEEASFTSQEVFVQEAIGSQDQNLADKKMIVQEQQTTSSKMDTQGEIISQTKDETTSSDPSDKSRVEAIIINLFCEMKKIPSRNDILEKFEEMYQRKGSEWYGRTLRSQFEKMVKEFKTDKKKALSRKEILQMYKKLYKKENRDYTKLEKALDESQEVQTQVAQ